MIKLTDLLEEINEDQFDISSLDSLDNEIQKALENAPKNEIIGTVSLVLALPGIISAITRIIETIAKKSGIQLKKKDPKWYQVIGKVTDEIDNYIDTPIRYILKPFIADQTKREKIAKIIKAVVLTLMSIYGAVDIKQIEPTITLIKNLAPDISNELIQTIVTKDSTKIGTLLKPLFS